MWSGSSDRKYTMNPAITDGWEHIAAPVCATYRLHPLETVSPCPLGRCREDGKIELNLRIVPPECCQGGRTPENAD